jgi:hypothetical protein
MRGSALVAALLAACSQSSHGNDSDVEAISAALVHLAQRDDATFPNKHGLLLVEPTSAVWTTQDLQTFGIYTRRNECQPRLEPMDLVVSRNSAPLPLQNMLSPSIGWRFVGTAEASKAGEGFPLQTSDGTPIKTVASISLPAFSNDGTEALVLVSFPWSVHTAIAEYVLTTNDSDEWKVKCSELHIYP